MLHVLNHPLITHKLSLMRDAKTTTKDFRENLDEIAGLMAYEVTRDLPTKDVEVETPICKTVTQQISKDVVLVPILRAGLGMVNGILELIPTAKIGHVGLYRDEETLEPHEYFAKYPKDLDKSVVMIVDPMLATGGSASAAITMIKKRGCKHIKFMGVIGAPEGVERLATDHPDVHIFVSTLDRCLNENGYILPGLGDAGDRLFGTK